MNAMLLAGVPPAAVAEAFRLEPPLGSPEPVQAAWTSEVARLETGAGAVLVKVFPAGRERSSLETALRLERAALEDGRIAIAEPLEGPDGWLAKLVDGNGRPRLVRVHRWVDGTPCAELAPSSGVSRAVGELLARLHALGGRAGTTADSVAPVDLARWRAAVGEARRLVLPWARDLEALTPHVEEAAAAVDELRRLARPLVLSHRDVDPKNCVVARDGRVHLFDWDYAGAVHPGVELADAALSFAGGVAAPDPRLVDAFVDAYRAAGGRILAADDLDLAPHDADVDWLLRNVEAALRGDRDGTTRAARLIRDWLPSRDRLREWVRAIAR